MGTHGTVIQGAFARLTRESELFIVWQVENYELRYWFVLLKRESATIRKLYLICVALTFRVCECY